jgi:hypothetical protein
VKDYSGILKKLLIFGLIGAVILAIGITFLASR